MSSGPNITPLLDRLLDHHHLGLHDVLQERFARSAGDVQLTK